ncbi:MAG: hypothetical protein EBZ24_01660 [Synechococcaceae bacterium WB9_4xB_025]|jgi:hypothetical protein|nr:hypothetical protein [Synechococcaceae bacterium WB9_4xB_025]
MEPAELLRCQQRDAGHEQWDRWGTYLSDRQWGTVREDYSADGNAWASFPYKQLRDENRQRGRDQPEFELVHTGAFDERRRHHDEQSWALTIHRDTPGQGLPGMEQTRRFR